MFCTFIFIQIGELVLSTNLVTARSDRMSKGRLWVISKKYRGYEASNGTFRELEDLAEIHEVMQDTNKVGII